MGKGKVGESCDLERGKWGVSRTWIRELRLCFLFGFLHEQMEIGFWGDSFRR